MDPDSRPASRTRRSGGARPARGPGLSVSVTDGRGRPVAAAGLVRWLARVAPARGAVAIALVSNASIRDLNRRYRRKDMPTDVLSFPADTPGAGLGDIAIATGVARRQAKAAGHSYDTELRILALHGVLHLVGYDHDAPDDNGRMGRAEARLRRKGGLPEGLIGRVSARKTSKK